ncbi:MAG: transcription antitermination factor NusB [Terracidiphilus sp.]|jgi:16S rRNA (cytosine967-C5)-methyltransferase
MPGVSPARKAAFQILLAVERGHSHSDDLLRGKGVNALSAADRNLATALVLGVLRWQIRLDHQLQALLTRPNAKLDAEILIALRLGAFQLLYMDRIPARAAIDESVELAKQAGHRFASGMVNAVLRKLAGSSKPKQELGALKGHDLNRLATSDVLKGHDFSRAADAEKWAGALAPEGSLPRESAAELALAESHPAWMVERWANFYGLEGARAICRHGQAQPVLTVRLLSPEMEAELVQAGIELSPGELLTAARTVVSGDITSTSAFNEGRVRLQDEGSQLIAELAGGSGANLGQRAKSILDCCAAPGGKTLILAECNPRARIVACESSAQRFEQLRKRLAGDADRVECRLADAIALTEDSVFDLALADVPCSGTGTLGRNPEIRHRLRLEDLPRQAERQRAILKSALRAVRPGGRVIYSTCSLEPEENEQVVTAVLAETPNARAASLGPRIEALASAGILTASGAGGLQGCLTQEGALRLLPGVFKTDGFFVALMERTG